MFGSVILTLIISSEEMNDIMKKVKSLEESGLLIKDVSEKIKNEVKEQKRIIFRSVIGNFRSYFIRIFLAGKGTIRAGRGRIRPGKNFYCRPIS